MASGFKINKQGIRNMAREIEREFAKNPVRVPLTMDANGVALPAATTVNNYNGPTVTVTGDYAQIAWGNSDVKQTQQTQQIAPGYENLARLLTDLLASVDSFGLSAEDVDEVRESAGSVLSEVVTGEPRPSFVKRGVTMIKGLLAPIAAGASKAVTEETAEATRQVIEALGNSLPS